MEEISMTDPVRPLSVSDPNAPMLVWYGVLDKTYRAEVRRITEYPSDIDGDLPLPQALSYCGELIIFKNEEPYEELFRQVVHLSYGAAFGPDVDDVILWQELTSAFIDKTLDDFYKENRELKDLTVKEIIIGKISMVGAMKAEP